MKIILLDTNIYGIALERKDVAQILVFLAEEKQKSEKRGESKFCEVCHPK